jgi:hypothetical protein
MIQNNFCKFIMLPSGFLRCPNCDQADYPPADSNGGPKWIVPSDPNMWLIRPCVLKSDLKLLGNKSTTSGPGTELKKLLSYLGIFADGDCPCNAHASEMDHNGPDWCEQNIETVVGWLEEEATKRNLPFFRFAGRQIVKLAIWRARRKATHSK